jgi:transposase
MRALGNTMSGGPRYSGAVADLPREPRETPEQVRARREAKADWRTRSPFANRTEREEKAALFAPHQDTTYSDYAFTTPPPRDDEPAAAPAPVPAKPRRPLAPATRPVQCGDTVEAHGQQIHCHLPTGHDGPHEDRSHRWDLPCPAAATETQPPALAARPRRRSAPTPRPVTRPAAQAGPRLAAATRPAPDAAGIVRDYVEDGMTIPQIARQRGHSTRTVRDLLKATPGVVMRDDRSTHSGGRNKIADDPRVVAAIRRLYVDEGLTQRQVAERLQLTYQVVRRVMQANGIEARPPASVAGHGSARPGTSTLARLRQAIEDAGLTARTLREWAAAHGIDVPTTGLPGWDVLNAYLAARPTATAPTARGSVRRVGNRWQATCSVCGRLDIAAVSHAATLAALGSHLRTHQPAQKASA